MGARKVAYVVFVLPVIISVVLGGYVMSNVLAQPDRQLNFFQISFPSQEAQVGSKDIRILNLNSSYPSSVPLSFTVRVNNTSFDCGDLYMTIYNDDTNQTVAQNAYFSQCFAQDNSTLPVSQAFSHVINKTGSYRIVAEMKDKSYLHDINVTARFNVQ